MSKKSDHLNLGVKNSGAVSLNTLDYTIKAKKSFQKIPGQPPKNIYRVQNLKATSLLKEAVVNGNIEQVEKLLKGGRAVDLSRKWSNGDTPLSYSVKKSNLGMTEFLLENGADPNRQDTKGNTPLHLAVAQQDTTMTKFLLENGAGPNILDSCGKPPLYSSRFIPNKETVKLLVAQGADLNLLGSSYPSGLLLDAMITEDQDYIELLLAHNALVDLQIVRDGVLGGHHKMLPIVVSKLSDKNIAPLEYDCYRLLDDILENIQKPHFCENNSIDTIQLLSDLLQACTVQNPSAHNFLFGSCTVSSLNGLYKKLHKKFNLVSDAFTQRVGLFSKYIASGKKLLSHLAQEKNDDDPLKELNYHCHFFLHHVKPLFPPANQVIVLKKKTDFMKTLYEAKYDKKGESNLSFRPNKQWEDLYYAAIQGDVEKVDELLQSGVDINIQDTYGYTPLHAAVRLNRIEVARLLLDKGAKVDVQGINRDTALHLAADQQDSEMAELLLKYKANPDIQGNNDLTPLHLAVISEDEKMVELLLKYKANPDIEQKHPKNDVKNGRTPLHIAAKGQKAIVELLLQYKANPNMIDSSNYFALSYAGSWGEKKYGNKEIVKLLLKYGADPNVKQAQSSRPGHLIYAATMQNDEAYMKCLMQHGIFIDIKMVALLMCNKIYGTQYHKMLPIILNNMSDENIAPVEQGTIRTPLFDAMLENMIEDFPQSQQIKEQIQQLSSLLQVFTENGLHLSDTEFLFGNNTPKLLEELYNLLVAAHNTQDAAKTPSLINTLENIVNQVTALTTKQEEAEEINDDPLLKELKENLTGFIKYFGEKVGEKPLDECNVIKALYIDSNNPYVQKKSAAKHIVPIEQSPEFLQQQQVKVQEQVKIVRPEDEGSDVPLSGEQNPKTENDYSE